MKRSKRVVLSSVCVVLVLSVACLAFAGGRKEETKEGKKIITFWWAGAWDVVKMPEWIDIAVKQYEAENPNIDIDPVQQSLDTLIPSFKAAAAAQEGPDIAFFWGGVWCLEDVWAGSIAPLSDYWSMDEIEQVIGYKDRLWNGKVWGVGYYLSGKPMTYNKKLFQKAGLDPEKPPKNWEQFVDVCKKLKNAGITPLGLGLKDQWQGGWMVSHWGIQDLDSPDDMKKVALGRAKLTEPKYSDWWKRLEFIIQQGYYNDDVLSLTADQGWDLFPQQRIAMVFATDSHVGAWVEELGVEAVGVARIPAMGKGKLSGSYFMETNGYSITSWSSHKEEAAEFLRWLYQEEQVNNFFKTTGTLHCSKKLDSNLIELPQLKKMWEWANSDQTGPHLENFFPTMLDEQGYFVAVAGMFAGQLTPEGAAELTQTIIEKWRKENPDRLDEYEKWLE